MNEFGRVALPDGPRWVRLAEGELTAWPGPPWEGREPGTDALRLDPGTAAWLPPVAPSKIVCFARTFPAHAVEMGAVPRGEPLLFLKAPSSRLAPGRPVLLPPESTRVECEGELALVISRRVRRFPPDGDVDEVVGGWLSADDVTARDLQRADGQWSRGKSFDTFCPLARTFSTRPPQPEARLVTTVNGETAQDSRLDAMSFRLAELLAWASSAMSLEPGDLVLTGTPAGVRQLAVGDEVRVSIDGIPELVHGVAAEAPPG